MYPPSEVIGAVEDDVAGVPLQPDLVEQRPERHAAVLHKRLVLAYLEELCHAAGLVEAKRVAATVNLLHEGATAVAQMSRSPDAARSARTIAAGMLQEEPRKAQANPVATSTSARSAMPSGVRS